MSPRRLLPCTVHGSRSFTRRGKAGLIFNTPIFFFFFLAFFSIYGLILVRQRPRVALIIVSSLVFYGAWNYRFIPLLVGSALADYFIALQIEKTGERSVRRRWVTLSLFINLGVLALFKYADFALKSVQDLLGAVGVDATLPTLQWVLPVGISFYTFQSLSYTIDVYRGDMKARRGLAEFVAALAFFPQLVAGPILRAKQILPQMHSLPTPTWANAKHGFVLITAGVFKKTFADLLAIPAATAFDGNSSASLIETWTGVLAFAGQIYGDFAGYTDMAIGIALLLGFKIPANFHLPYFATSPVDFWRRWHISLSTWLRDYLYISLGGNRTGSRWRNVMITMLLGGLWHGAAWTFVAWGAFHGALIALSHAFSRIKLLSFFQSGSRIASLLKWAMTFYLVLIGWVLFRATSFGNALDVLSSMHGLGDGALPGGKASLILGSTIIVVALMHLVDLLVIKKAAAMESRAWALWLFIILINAICLMVGEPSNEFIYFQF